MNLEQIELKVTALLADLHGDYFTSQISVLKHGKRIYKNILLGRSPELIASEVYLIDKKIDKVEKEYVRSSI